MKRITTAFLAIAFMIACYVTSYAGTWEAVGTDWKYKNDIGAYSANCWQWIDGKCYCFKADGIMYKDCTTPDGYKVNKDGAWVNDKGEVQMQQAGTSAAAASNADQRLVYLNKHIVPGDSDAAISAKYADLVQRAKAGDKSAYVSDYRNMPQSYNELKNFLTSIDWPNMTEMQRVEACYKRIATGYNGNKYGYPSFADKEMAVLVHKTGICKDYAKEMTMLCRFVGLEAYSEGRTYYGAGHELCKVKIDGVWYVIDPTWAEGQPMTNMMYRYDDPKVTQIYETSEGIHY